MKILFTLPRLSYSGAPKMMAWIANQMAERGYEVHLVTFYSEEQARLLHENVRIRSLKIDKSRSRIIRNTTGMLKTICRLHKTINELKPDIVVSFLDSVGCAYLPIGRLFTKAKYVISERADPYARHGITFALRVFLKKFAHKTVFQTDGAQRFFENCKRIYDNSVVIPNPVVISDCVMSLQKRIPSFAERDKRIVTVGRLALYQKRQDILLDAFKLFHEKNPEYILMIYGDGPDGRKIQEMIVERKLSGYAFLAGRTDRVEKEIFNAAAFTLTSDFDGIPNALIEAMSIGVPSVSTDCSPGGAALLIRDGENGFIVPRGDVEAIAERLSRIVSDETLANCFSKNSVYITNEFSESVIAEKWEALFRHTAETKRWA